MKKFIYFAIGIATMLMATSCEKDVFNSTSNEGGFSLSLNVNNQETVTSRAVMSAEEVKNSAQVKIYMPINTGLIREYTYGDMEPVIYLPTGNGYRVDVVAGEAAQTNPDKANFENKSYAGSADFDIVANQITNNVKVTAKINNAITNVTFDDTIAENFNEGYTLTFALAENESNAENTLVYSATQTGEGYFIVNDPLKENKLYWSFVGTKNDGTEFKAKGAIEAPESTGGSLVGTRHTMNFKYVVKDGKLTFTLVVDKETTTITDKIVWTPTSTGLSTIKNKDIWAKFVTIGGDVDTKEYDGNKKTADVFDADVYIQYREKSDAEWAAPTAVTADMVKVTTLDKDGAFSQVVQGIDPATVYESRMVINKTNIPTETEGVTTNEFIVIDGVKEFTTPVAQQVPNRSFEGYYRNNSGDGYYVFNPESGYGFETTVWNASPGNQHTWWGTGNQVKTIVVDITVAVTSISSDVPHKDDGNSHSVFMKSTEKANIWAAGNIYSGYFAGTKGTNGTVHFGRNTAADGKPFASRPTGVSFYVKYKSEKIANKGNHPSLTTEDYDEGQVKVAIGTWDPISSGFTTGSTESPIALYTGDYENQTAAWDLKKCKGTIAYADMIFTKEHNNAGWMKVTLPLNYENTSTPSHIIISAASSRFGDYFAAGPSEMYLDDIELLYDYETSQLTGPKIE